MGEIYEGEFQYGKPNGKGTKTYANERTYEGEFQDGEPNGKGTMTYPDNQHPGWQKCEGTMKSGVFVGNVTITYKTEDIYIGPFPINNLSCKGKMTYADGSKYKGTFKNEKPNGKGKMTYPKRQHPNWKQCEGTMENGTFKNDVTITYKTGEIYIGTFPMDNLTVNGTMTYPNGDKYQGQFQ